MEIILYTTHCPKCMVIEKKLQQKNIPFNSCEDVSTLVDRGFKQAPILFVDGQYLEFGDAVKWINGR